MDNHFPPVVIIQRWGTWIALNIKSQLERKKGIMECYPEGLAKIEQQDNIRLYLYIDLIVCTR